MYGAVPAAAGTGEGEPKAMRRGKLAFGAVLRGAAGHRRAGPWLVMVPGAAAAAPGAFQRKQLLLTGRASLPNGGTTRSMKWSAASQMR